MSNLLQCNGIDRTVFRGRLTTSGNVATIFVDHFRLFDLLVQLKYGRANIGTTSAGNTCVLVHYRHHRRPLLSGPIIRRNPSYSYALNLANSLERIKRRGLSLAILPPFHYSFPVKSEIKNISISLLQTDPTRRGAKDRIAQTLRKVETVAEARSGVLVLPEIWSGGFTYPDVKRISRQTPDLLKELCAISKKTSSLIVGSLPEMVESKLYNTAAVVDRGRIIGRYHKQRLFSPMEEDRHFATRRSKRVYRTEQGSVGVAICFDLRFPERFVGLRKKGVWLLIIPAQWPKPRCTHWETLLTARAIEGQLFVAGCNRVGRSGKTSFCGNSMIVNPWGKVLARGGTREETVTAIVRPEEVEVVRRRLPLP
jgi:omega-amidase